MIYRIYYSSEEFGRDYAHREFDSLAAAKAYMAGMQPHLPDIEMRLEAINERTGRKLTKLIKGRKDQWKT